MVTRSISIPAAPSLRDRPGSHPQPCPCGCAPCESDGCGLDCLEQPRFFCGQLLTDQDLTALLTWVKSKNSLARYREGWGVACGLSVSCAGEAGKVVIGSGYARSCCGDDIVVCDDHVLDLSDLCRYEDPCADLRPDGEGQQTDVRVVDVYLKYQETPSSPQSALGRGSCNQASECEYGRTTEGFVAFGKPAYDGSDPMSVRADEWHEGYRKCLDVLNQFILDSPQSIGDRRRWLLRWLERHPLHQFCFVKDWLCTWPDEQLEGRLVEVLFWLVQDCRNAYLACDCASCHDGTDGVPLARVWLTVGEERGRAICSVTCIDAYAPYRRELALECLPAPLGVRNLGGQIWHRREEVCSALADLGVRVRGEESFGMPDTPQDLRVALDCSPFVECGDAVTLQVFRSEELCAGGRRVVGFCASVAPPASPPAIEVRKVASRESAGPGDEIDYKIAVRNHGPGAVRDVTVRDAQIGVNDSGLVLREGEGWEGGGTYRVQERDRGGIRNVVTVTGRDEQGRPVTGEATAFVEFVLPESPEPPEVVIDKSGPEASGPGTLVTYTVTVKNPNAFAITATVKENRSDVRLDREGEPILLPAGGGVELRAQFRVPREGPPVQVNTVTVVAEAPGRPSATRTAEHTLKVSQGSGGGGVVIDVPPIVDERPPIVVDPSGPVINPGGPVIDRPVIDRPVISGGVRADLTIIRGIGDARARILVDAGIADFGALAETPVERLRELMGPLVPEADLERWVTEAREHAGG